MPMYLRMLQVLTATQTTERAQALLQSGKAAGLPELLKLIETLTDDLGRATIAEIADLIEQDTVVVSRLLSIANTVYHNPNIAPLSSVPHAIHHVGFHRIRSLAVSLMLIENTGRVDNPPEQREAAAHALCAGLLAQGIAGALGGVDPEVAFACASLRHLGSILLPIVSLEHYRAAHVRLKAKPEDIAYRGVFGLTPLELSRRLLEQARLPGEITRSLRECEPQAIERFATSADSRLLVVADLGGRLARLTLDPQNDSEAFRRKAGIVARRHCRLAPDAASLIELALQHAEERIATFQTAGTSNPLPAAMLLRIQAHLRPKVPVTPISSAEAVTPRVAIAGAGTEPTAPSASLGETTTAAARVPVDQQWTTELQRSSAFATQHAKLQAQVDPWEVAVEALHRTFEADEIGVFLPAHGGQSFVLRYGTGGQWRHCQSRAALRQEEHTIFGVCLSRLKTVVIHNTRESSIQRYLPQWFQDCEIRLGALLLMPLLEPHKGLVLIGWRAARQVAPSAEQSVLAHLLFKSIAASQ